MDSNIYNKLVGACVPQIQRIIAGGPAGRHWGGEGGAIRVPDDVGGLEPALLLVGPRPHAPWEFIVRVLLDILGRGRGGVARAMGVCCSGLT